MKRKLGLLFMSCILILIGCSRSNVSTRLVSYFSDQSLNPPTKTVVAALDSLQSTNPAKFHEFTAFQMATDYRVSYIATDPFASSPFENFLILQYMGAFMNQSTYEITDVQQLNDDASVTLKVQLPNYIEILDLSLPSIIQTYRQEYASINIDDVDAKLSIINTMNDMIQNSCQDSDSSEVINTFKLKYIEGSWYIVDNGELYGNIKDYVQFYNRQL